MREIKCAAEAIWNGLHRINGFNHRKKEGRRIDAPGWDAAVWLEAGRAQEPPLRDERHRSNANLLLAPNGAAAVTWSEVPPRGHQILEHQRRRNVEHQHRQILEIQACKGCCGLQHRATLRLLKVPKLRREGAGRLRQANGGRAVWGRRGRKRGKREVRVSKSRPAEVLYDTGAIPTIRSWIAGQK